ncbi:MAG: response regulator transcription factor [Dehalococcoidia bacterium]|nr:response regulator transcription factor [Dehalococcoidia bacterium]
MWYPFLAETALTQLCQTHHEVERGHFAHVTGSYCKAIGLSKSRSPDDLCACSGGFGRLSDSAHHQLHLEHLQAISSQHCHNTFVDMSCYNLPMIVPLLNEPTILVVDDEKHIVELVSLHLTSEGYHVETAFDGLQAMEKFRILRPSLVVLDIMMPTLDGWEFCRMISKKANVPIIILTARADDVDKIIGFELGADDYIVKPFNPRELIARVKAVLRRTQSVSRLESVVALGNLRIDFGSRAVTIDNAPVALRPKEFDLLLALASNPDFVFSREKLLEQVWGYSFPGNSRTIDVHVTWLRRKLAKADVHIRTVWGIGYKLTPAG